MTLVRTATGEKILCAWDDCPRPGQDEIRIEKPQDEANPMKGNLIYIFCTERHKALYQHSHRELRRLPVGSRGLPAPR